MKTRTIYLLLWLCIGGSHLGFSQDDYIFELVTIKERANFGDVHNIYEDPIGIIWMGIYGKGLAYYNGKEIIRYSLLNEERFANTEDVFVGKGDFIYLNDGDGVRILDPIKQEEPERISLPKKFREMGEIKSIAISEDNGSTIIWATLAFYDPSSGAKYHIITSKNRGEFQQITNAPITTFGPPEIKSLGNRIVVKGSQGLMEINELGQTMTTYDLPLEYIENLTTFNWNVDEEGTIRLGGKCTEESVVFGPLYACEIWEKRKGAHEFTKKDIPSYDTYATKLKETKKYLRFLSVIDQEPYQFLRETDSINFATNLAQNKRLKVYTINDVGHKPGNIFKVYKSKSGIIWMGGSNGLSKMVPRPRAFKMLPPLGRRSMIEDEEGNVYGSTNWVEIIQPDKTILLVSSIKKYDPVKNEVTTHFSTTDTEGYWFQANYYNGRVFHNSFSMNLETGEVNTLPEIQEDLGHAYLSLVDRNGKLWKAHWGVPLVGIYDPETGQRIKKTTIPQLVSKSVDLNDWYQRPSDGTVWLGTYGQGIFIFSEDGTLIKHLNRRETSEVILNSNVISGFYEDTNGVMWIGHGAGLSAITKDLSQIEHYTFNESQPESRLVYSILPEDNDRYLWLSTSKGLFRFDTQMGIFQDFPLHPQMMDFEFNRTSYFKGSNGQFYFGTSGSRKPTVSFFAKDAIDFYNNISSQKSNIIITSFNKFDASEERAITQSRQLQDIHEIVLKPGDRYFELEYLVTDYRSPQNNYYSFYLENYDENWSPVARGSNKVRYENLPPGTYQLKLKGALLADGIAANERIIKVSVLPFWYQTWWAKLLFGLIVLSIGILIYRFNLNRQFQKQEQLRLQEVDQLKSRLFTNITHEFRTPLTVIMGMNETIKGFEKERALIKRNASSLLGLINQLLDLSKLESGALKIENKEGDIILYLQYLTESFYSMASDKKVNLSFQSLVGSLVMQYDEVKLQHIIYNLLTNAIKFTRPGGKVNLSIQEDHDTERPMLEIKVKDTGVGISAADLPHVFDRFYQGGASNPLEGVNKTFGGTGIGLALTKELVEIMNGTITVESEESWGSTFSVRLPIRRATANLSTLEGHPKISSGNDYQTRSEEVNPMPDHVQSNRSHVLLIEDNSGVVAYIKTILDASYEVTVAINGREGIDMALERIPDVVITDVMMPEKNGYEVCDFLKNDERTSHIPIIILTAKAGATSRIEGLATGADAYIAKPFEREELEIQIKNTLHLRKVLQRHYSGHKEPIDDDIKTEKKEYEFVQKIKSYVTDHIQDSDLSVAKLSGHFNLTHIQLYRKLKALTGQTPSQFIRFIRLEKSLVLLRSSDLNISEVAYQVGFNDPNYFTRVFKQEYGKVPGEVQVKD